MHKNEKTKPNNINRGDCMYSTVFAGRMGYGVSHAHRRMVVNSGCYYHDMRDSDIIARIMAGRMLLSQARKMDNKQTEVTT